MSLIQRTQHLLDKCEPHTSDTSLYTQSTSSKMQFEVCKHQVVNGSCSMSSMLSYVKQLKCTAKHCPAMSIQFVKPFFGTTFVKIDNVARTCPNGLTSQVTLTPVHLSTFTICTHVTPTTSATASFKNPRKYVAQ